MLFKVITLNNRNRVITESEPLTLYEAEYLQDELSREHDNPLICEEEVQLGDCVDVHRPFLRQLNPYYCG